MAALLIAVLAAAVLAAREVTWRRTVASLVAEQTRLRDELRDVSGLAQDLKSPLQGVIGNTELMIAAGGAASASADELRDIRDSAARAAGIVRTLTAVAATSELSRTWQDVNDVVARAVEGCRPELHASGLRVEFDRAERLPLVYVDGIQLERALSALLLRPAPRIAPRRERAAARLSTRRRDGDDRIVIEFDDPTLAPMDAGPSPADLAASRHIVEAHGGTLAIEQPGLGGYRFVLELPVWTT